LEISIKTGEPLGARLLVAITINPRSNSVVKRRRRTMASAMSVTYGEKCVHIHILYECPTNLELVQTQHPHFTEHILDDCVDQIGASIGCCHVFQTVNYCA
jgi:hypothetical protein